MRIQTCVRLCRLLCYGLVGVHNESSKMHIGPPRRLLTIAGVLLFLDGVATYAIAQTSGLGVIEHEVMSKYSHIRVRKQGTRRMLNFVRDGGREVIETIVDLEKPHHLLAPYTQTMFVSWLFQPEQKKVLMIGLGGGAMVLFLRKHAPKTNADVVEIDPEVVKIAEKYFGVKSTKEITIHTRDAFDFLKKSKDRYDAIYMDAFLKPSKSTDATGVPLRLKTRRFLKSLQTKLTPTGVVVFNLNEHRSVGRDVATIRGAFPQMYVFKVGGTGGLVVIASKHRKRVSTTVLRKRAEQLDARWRANFSFQKLSRMKVR